MPTPASELRIGIDLGGTKIAAVALTDEDQIAGHIRRATPRNDYAGTLRELVAMINELETAAGPARSVGIAMPGSIAPATGRVQNANSTWLNGQSFREDLAALAGRPIRTANDANCFALSEAHDGAARDAHAVFGVILGTGCGGGLVLAGQLLDGHRGIGGEWGHNPLPWPEPDELPGPACWCGRNGCLETWISGPALAADHARATGDHLSAEDIVTKSDTGDREAIATLDRHAGRIARGLATLINTIDPDVIVLGGGLSELDHLYSELPERITPFIFAADRSVDIRRPRWGPASGVRGAARLWDSN